MPLRVKRQQGKRWVKSSLLTMSSDKRSANPLRGFPLEVQILIVASFFVAVGFGIVMPAIPVFAKSFGVNNASIGLIVSAFAIARFASGLISGKLVDRFGERIVFSVGVAMVAISTLLAGLAQNYHQLLIFRSAGGLGSSMFSVAAGSVIMRAVDDDHRGRAQSVYNGAFLIGGIAGPAIGGALSIISLRAPFFAYSITLICSGLIAGKYLKSSTLTADHENDTTDSQMKISKAIKLAPYRIALVMAFIGSWALFGLRSSILPLFVTESLHSSTAVVGYGFTLAALFQGSLLLQAGKTSDIRGRKYVSLIGTSIVMVGIVILILSVHPWMYLFSMVIMGAGTAFIATVPASIVGDILEGRGGQVIALFQMAGDAGMMVGPIVVGAISDVYSYRTAFIATAVIFAISIVLSARLPETRKSHLQ